MIKKIAGIISIIILALAATSPLVFFRLKELERIKCTKTEEHLWQEEAAQKKAGKQLSSLENDTDFVQNKLTERKKEAESLESELVSSKRQIDSTQNRITEIDKKVISAQKRIEQANTNIAELKVRIANVLNDKLKVTKELTLLQKTTAALKERLTEYLEREKDEEETIAEGPSLTELGAGPQAGLQPEPGADIPEEPRPAMLKPSLAGEVLIVNREFDFVVVNLGRNEGLQEGMVLDISRDDNILSRAEVETVRTAISAAALVDKKAVSQIRAGDKVLFYKS